MAETIDQCPYQDYLVNDALFMPQLRGRDRDSVLEEMATPIFSARQASRDDIKRVLYALIRREENGSTGFGKGMAVPHIKFDKRICPRISIAWGLSPSGVDFGALDHQPVRAVILMLSPDNQPQRHLQTMNAVFSFLGDEPRRKKLLTCATRREMEDVVREFLLKWRR